jgi:IS5 family transposase
VAIPKKGTFRVTAEKFSLVSEACGATGRDQGGDRPPQDLPRDGACRTKEFSGDRMNVSWAILAWNTKKCIDGTPG